MDGARVIKAAGDKVSKERVGERVWLYNGQSERAMDTATEYIALPSEHGVQLHDNASFLQGACLGGPPAQAITASPQVVA
jgi:NADPH2:quinone reductase